MPSAGAAAADQLLQDLLLPKLAGHGRAMLSTDTKTEPDCSGVVAH